MARWRKKSLDELTDRLVQLGLSSCPVCQSGLMGVTRRPVVLSVGAMFREVEHRTDPDCNVIFMVRVTCDVCGYAMLFDSEKFNGSDKPTLVRGPEEAEEAWEAGQED